MLLEINLEKIFYIDHKPLSTWSTFKQGEDLMSVIVCIGDYNLYIKW